MAGLSATVPRLLQLRQDGAEPQHAPRDLAAILLIVANPVHGLLDLEPDLDDPLHGGHRIGHRSFLQHKQLCSEDVLLKRGLCFSSGGR